jgi:2-oxo-4-hydroxy-4-carboxy--5-ureidoimidazoline (OHCU) decarboxylase
MLRVVFMHQGIGLAEFNEMPHRKAVHALYECCSSVLMAGDLATGRPYSGHDALFRKADALLFSLSEESIDDILQAYPKLGSRPGSYASHAEHCAVWDERPGVMQLLDSSAATYAERFGFQFVMWVPPQCPVPSVLTAIADRMHHDVETERKIMRNEIAKINRSRLERMLGPEAGYNNWV